MLPAVAVKVVEMALAGTDTEEAGTGRRLLLLANPTAAPPLGTAWFNATVHVVFPPLFSVAGLHDKDESCDVADAAVTTPPVAVTAIACPEGDDATLLVTPIGVLFAPLAIVRFTTATMPFAIVVAFVPVATQVYVPLPVEQSTILLPLTAAGPALAEIETTLLAG
jgi:hypothetical protein